MNARNLSLPSAGQLPPIKDGPAVANAPNYPRVEPGQGRSRNNALKHGLTATTLLPEVLGTEMLERHKERLRAEWQPTSPTQEILVLELARHAASLELVEQAEGAVLRCGAQSTVDILSPNDTGIGDNADPYLAAAVTSDALERVSRYRRAHEKGFYLAILRLREAKALEQPSQDRDPRSREMCFLTEDDCEAYLIRWAQRDNHRCPGCGHTRCYWLANRRRWQCTGCNRQLGLRAGTVMQGSPLPLRCWFRAIRSILAEPNIGTKELAAITGVRRLPTVRRLAARIREVLALPSATDLLAGLNQVFQNGPTS